MVVVAGVLVDDGSSRVSGGGGEERKEVWSDARGIAYEKKHDLNSDRPHFRSEEMITDAPIEIRAPRSVSGHQLGVLLVQWTVWLLPGT